MLLHRHLLGFARTRKMPERVGHSRSGAVLVTPDLGNNSAPEGTRGFERIREELAFHKIQLLT